MKSLTGKKKFVSMAVFILGFCLLGLFYLYLTDPTFKPKLYNFLRLNPTVRYVGKLAPNVEMIDLRSRKKVRLHDYRGKVILLEFWATWCPDCLRQLPLMQKLHNDPTLRGKVKVLTVNIKDPASRNPTLFQAWLDRSGYSFPVLLGGMDVLKVYKVRFLPTMLVINRQGRVLHSSPEFHREQDVRLWIKRAMKSGN